MSKNFLLLLFLMGCVFVNSNAQSSTKTFTTKFIPYHITYNGSDNPNECWESVAWGIIVEDGDNSYYFSLSYRDLELLKEKIGDAEVVVQVQFWEEPSSDSGEDGNVIKITLNGVIIFGD